MGLRSEEQQRLAELHRDHVLSMMPYVYPSPSYPYCFYFPELEGNNPFRLLTVFGTYPHAGHKPTAPLRARMDHMLDRFTD